MEPRRLQRIDWATGEYFAGAFVSHENIAEYYCIVCDADIYGDDTLADHLSGKIHRTALLEFSTCITPYEDDHYYCSTCNRFISSYTKVHKHIYSRQHQEILDREERAKKGEPQSILSSSSNSDAGVKSQPINDIESLQLIDNEESPSKEHKTPKVEDIFFIPELSDMTKTFLAQSDTSFEEMRSFLDYVCGTEQDIYKRVMEDLRCTIRRNNSDIKFCTFGCRDFNTSMSERYMDIFLGCQRVYRVESKLADEILLLLTSVSEYLKKDSQTWEFREFFKGNRSPVIKIRHRPTGVSCEISFEIGLVMDGTEFIGFFNHIFPQFEKLLFFLKRWLTLCNLAGHQHFSIYTLYWSLVYYLQTDSRLPSVASLISVTDKIGRGFEISARTSNTPKAFCSIKKLLIGYFEFYANFDFQSNVACPVLGDAVKKQAFEDLRLLPTEMESYLVHMEYSDTPELFQIECAMCIQDPFSLHHNLTTAVSKDDLVRFRTYCSMSLEKLRST